ncbi:DUF4232 domain-containing protein [Streptomyces olindensis]|uniref:DUF4232 domain-containing protein n=1 Tax=Streptomyces olindensis TaxID=358823 RepID=A0ABV2XYU1_9ACTN
MAKTSQSLRRAALLASAVAVLGSLTACDTAHRTETASRQLSATGGATRCHTSELRASVGRMDPGAGQRNLPVVLTNVSSRSCTLHGHPGAAFVDASGRRLGPDPERTPDAPATVTLAPGETAWAGLRYASPEVSGARAATPAALLVTPPDERESLRVRWTADEVPAGGNAASVYLTALAAGSGP